MVKIGREHCSGRCPIIVARSAITPDDVYRMLLRYAGPLRLDIEGFGPHTLRATAATNALDHNADIAKVKQWLGHANISTCRVYDRRSKLLINSASSACRWQKRREVGSIMVRTNPTKPDVAETIMKDQLPMNYLDVMAGACVDALEHMEEDPHWRSAYTSLVDPHSVLQIIAMARQQQEPKPERTSEEELQAIGKLVRDLAGYLKLVTGDKPDPVRDDLLLQARQLLGLAGM